ncbi:MAG: hypothetical protein JO023_02630 [Chloroflexi bacterium]|nr:hypothetical protein [Chloroflexota bacterium]
MERDEERALGQLHAVGEARGQVGDPLHAPGPASGLRGTQGYSVQIRSRR